MSMAASTPNILRVALRRRYMTELALAARRRYVNLILDRTKYVGTGRAGINTAQIKQKKLGRADACDYVGLWTEHDTDVPPRDDFLTKMGGQLGRCSRLGLDGSQII